MSRAHRAACETAELWAAQPQLPKHVASLQSGVLWPLCKAVGKMERREVKGLCQRPACSNCSALSPQEGVGDRCISWGAEDCGAGLFLFRSGAAQLGLSACPPEPSLCVLKGQDPKLTLGARPCPRLEPEPPLWAVGSEDAGGRQHTCAWTRVSGFGHRCPRSRLPCLAMWPWSGASPSEPGGTAMTTRTGPRGP